MDISDRIKIVRGNLSQEEFAQKLGVHKNSLGRYERRDSIPGVDVAEKICFVFGINPQWLLLGKGPMQQGEADAQAQDVGVTASTVEAARGSPSEDWAKQAALANERLYQAWEREREMQKEIGRLEKEVGVLRERIDAREQTIADRDQMIADLREFYEIQEEDVGSEELSVLTAHSKGSINK